MRITKHFRIQGKAEQFSHVSDEDWNSGEWQRAHLTSQGLTPYYSGITQSAPALLKLNSSGILNAHLELTTLSESELESLVDKKQGPIHVNASFLARNPMSMTRPKALALSTSEQVIIETAFHHPLECTREALEAASILADQGFILNNRMHLISGLNDDAETLKRLHHLLLMMRIRPYCIFVDEPLPEMADNALGLVDALRGWTSGLAVPHLLFKTSDGYSAKVPEYIKERRDDGFVFRNYRNDTFPYREK